MPLSKLTLARAEIVVGGAFVALAALVIYEGVRLGPGWGESGPDPGFFPFSLAVVMGLGAAVAFIQAFLMRSTAHFFEERQEIVDLLRAGLPMAAAFALLPVLGLYLTAATYTWFFACWYGQFRWHSGLLSGVVLSAVLFALLDKGFHIPMPHSIWHGSYLPF